MQNFFVSTTSAVKASTKKRSKTVTVVQIACAAAVFGIIFAVFARSSPQLPEASDATSNVSGGTTERKTTSSRTTRNPRTTTTTETPPSKVVITARDVGRIFEKACFLENRLVLDKYITDELYHAADHMKKFKIKLYPSRLNPHGLTKIDSVKNNFIIWQELQMKDVELKGTRNIEYGYYRWKWNCKMTQVIIVATSNVSTVLEPRIKLQRMEIRDPVSIKCRGFRNDILKKETAEEKYVHGVFLKYIQHYLDNNVKPSLSKHVESQVIDAEFIP